MCIRSLRIVFTPCEITTAALLRITTAQDAATIFANHLTDEPVEVFAVICLNVAHEPIGYYEVSRGTVDGTLVHPREVFKPAILTNASAVIAAHNHPSGHATPSATDRALTERLIDAGALLGIPLLDHLVIGAYGTFYSFRLSGHVPA